MLENTNIKQFYPGPIVNRTLEITNFLFRNPRQVKLQKTALDEYGNSYDVSLTYGTDYEVQKVLLSDISIEAASLTASTGTIILKNSVEVREGEKLTAYRESDLVQDTNYPRTGAFPAASHEGALDYLTMQNQEQQEQIDRALKIPISVQNFDSQMPVPIAGKALKIDSTGKKMALSDLDIDEAYNTIQQYRDETLTAKNDASTQAELAAQKAELAAQKASSATSRANSAAASAKSAAESAIAAQDTLSAAVQTITSSKTSALDEINSSKTSALINIQTQQNLSVNSIRSTGDNYIKTFNSYKSDINQSKENAKDFYQKAVGWNIQYETDGEEDCLVFEDRTEAEINQAKNYIEDTRDKAITTIQNKTTEGINNISATEDSVVNSVKTQGEQSVENVTLVKNNATTELTQIANDTKSNIIAIKNQAVTEVRNASATNINTATSNGLNEIATAKNSAVSACAEQVALAKEYAQQANGWDFSYQDETLVFTRNEV